RVLGCSETAEPLAGQGDRGVWLLQGRQMTTVVKNDRPGAGEESAHLGAMLRGGEAIFTAPNEKRRTVDTRQIRPSIMPIEQRRVLEQDHGRPRLTCHPTETACSADGVRTVIVRDRARQLLDDLFVFPALHATVSSQCGGAIDVRPGIASHEP